MLRRTQQSRAALPRRTRSTRYIGLVVAWQIVVIAVLALVLQRHHVARHQHRVGGVVALQQHVLVALDGGADVEAGALALGWALKR